MVDDCIGAGSPFLSEASREHVAEGLCREIELYGSRHMNIGFAVDDMPSAAVMTSYEQSSTKVVPLIEAHVG